MATIEIRLFPGNSSEQRNVLPGSMVTIADLQAQVTEFYKIYDESNPVEMTLLLADARMERDDLIRFLTDETLSDQVFGENRRGAIIFLSPYVVLNPPFPDDLASDSPYMRIKDNQLGIRSCISYGIAKIVQHDIEREGLETLSRKVCHMLNRIAAKERNRVIAVERNRMIASGDIKQHSNVASAYIAPQFPQWPKVGDVLTEMRLDIESMIPLAYGEKADVQIDDAGTKIPSEFLKLLATIYKVGRVPNEAMERDLIDIPWIRDEGGSYWLRRKVERIIRSNEKEAPLAPVRKLNAILDRYHTYRDLARCLSTGTAHWARSKGRVIKALIIDDILFVDQSNPKSNTNPNDHEQVWKYEEERFTKRIRQIGKNLMGDAVQFDYLNLGETKDKWVWKTIQHHLDGRENGLETKLLIEAATDIPKAEPEEWKQCPWLCRYDFIFLDIAFKEEFVGAEAVEHLSRYFETHGGNLSPRIIVVSRTDNQAQIHQTMSHGADSFVSKKRMFQIPARMVQVRMSESLQLLDGRKSNFHSLDKATPRMMAVLQSREPDDFFVGDYFDSQWLNRLPKTDLHHHIGTTISLDTITAMALNSSGYLLEDIKAKSFGESGLYYFKQDQENKEIADARENKRRPEDFTSFLRNSIFDPICRMALLTGALWKREERNGRHPAECFQVAALIVILADDTRPEHRFDTVIAQHLKQLRAKNETELTLEKLFALRFDNNVYDHVVEILTPGYRQVAHHHVCSLLVSAIWSTRKKCENSSDPRKEWDYLDHISKLTKKLRSYHNADGDEQREQVLREIKVCQAHMPNTASVEACRKRFREEVALILKVADDAIMLRQRIRENVRHTGLIREIGREESVEKQCLWDRCQERVQERLATTTKFLDIAIADLIDDKRKAWDAQIYKNGSIAGLFHELDSCSGPSLGRLVRIPDVPKLGDKTLGRYLCGAGLLGSEHLQYPENILLAGRDLIRRAVNENIIYSEVRCETTGYIHAGMSAPDATDLLKRSCDLAAVYYAPLNLNSRLERPKDDSIPPRWVRTNILLGAKRHKGIDKFHKIVELLSHYLQQSSRPNRNAVQLLRRELDYPQTGKFDFCGYDDPFKIAPVWWAPSDVVGFDLSGDENTNSQDFRSSMEPLFRYSAPITVHAGEAATAESIWNAVYQMQARRIGHGLRLRENERLLNYCISEGICMELCPISNEYTNTFDRMNPEDSKRAGAVQYYPLRHYLQRGLDVCINTDNCQLHTDRTLTDEYIRAAKMVGGMTKWEILKLLKAGFKHAFLSKSDIQLMLRYVEEEVYDNVVARQRIKGTEA